MISHDSICYIAQSMGIEKLKLKPFKSRLVSFLPLSHIAGQILDMYGSLSLGLTVYFAQPDALKGGLVRTLKEVRPSVLFAVPRVWEKIEEGIRQKLNLLNGVKKGLFV